jgi:hypothetical protein
MRPIRVLDRFGRVAEPQYGLSEIVMHDRLPSLDRTNNAR